MYAKDLHLLDVAQEVSLSLLNTLYFLLFDIVHNY